ncbi:MAG: hypothetical protein D6706_13590 [Chloroflexi bacterium]|nr:MAG: hypothetical protein D6706_13590 [Chloroflexota bacterium]
MNLIKVDDKFITERLQELRNEYDSLRSYACRQADFGNWGPTSRLNELAEEIRLLEALEVYQEGV